MDFISAMCIAIPLWYLSVMLDDRLTKILNELRKK